MKKCILGVMLIVCLLSPSLAVGEEKSAREDRESRAAARSQDGSKNANDSAKAASREGSKTGKSAQKEPEKAASHRESAKSQNVFYQPVQPMTGGQAPVGEDGRTAFAKGRGNWPSSWNTDPQPNPAAAQAEGKASSDETAGRGRPSVALFQVDSSGSNGKSSSLQARETRSYFPLDARLEPEPRSSLQVRPPSELNGTPFRSRIIREQPNPAPRGEVKPATLANNSEAGKVYSPVDSWLNPERRPGGEIHPVPNLKADRFRTRVRQDNATPARDDKPSRPAVIKKPDGEKVTPNFFDRQNNPTVGVHYRGIHQHFGRPKYNYYYLPRPVNSYSIAYRVGYRDGLRDSLHYRPYGYGYGRPVYSGFYFGFYFDDPYYFNFWYSGYYPSVYHYYGWVPRWCQPPGIVVYNLDPYPYSWQRPVYYYYQEPASRVDAAGARKALSALERAWVRSDIDYFADYLREGENISIYFDNEYSYSLPAEDFYTMTLDAMSTVKTLSLAFDEPIWLNPNEFFVTARHIFISPDNLRQTVYISYRLHRYGGDWYIITAGSSPQPIAHNYRDFRYR